MRFRLSSVTGLGPSGFAVDGEVEDYEVEIGSPVSLILGRRTPGVTTLYPLRRDAGTGVVRVSFYNKTPGHVKLQVQTVAGEVVSTVVNGSLAEGFQRLTVGNRPLSTGMYVVRLLTPDRTIVRRVLIGP
jgi:hypothetical protein